MKPKAEAFGYQEAKQVTVLRFGMAVRKAKTSSKAKQIPGGNDRKKGKGNSKGNGQYRDPSLRSRMTPRKAQRLRLKQVTAVLRRSGGG